LALDVVQVAVGVEAPHVPGMVPAVAEGVGGDVGLPGIPLEDYRATHHDLPGRALRYLAIVVVHQPDPGAGHRPSGGARPVGHALDRHEAARLGLAEAGPELSAGLLVQAPDGRGRVEA